MSISLNVSAPSAIPNLDALVSTVGDWLDRNDVDTKIPTFIQMAEATFNRELRNPQMERSVVFSASSEDTNLPSDYLAMRAIYEEGSPDLPLKAVSATAIRQNWDGATGTPVGYCLVSGGIRLVPPPASEILLAMDYWAQLDALSVYAPSNWLLEQHPDAYLYATLFHAECYLDNPVRSAQWKGLLELTMDRINRAAKNDQYGAGPLVPSTVRQVRGAAC